MKPTVASLTTLQSQLAQLKLRGFISDIFTTPAKIYYNGKRYLIRPGDVFSLAEIFSDSVEKIVSDRNPMKWIFAIFKIAAEQKCEIYVGITLRIVSKNPRFIRFFKISNSLKSFTEFYHLISEKMAIKNTQAIPETQEIAAIDENDANDTQMIEEEVEEVEKLEEVGVDEEEDELEEEYGYEEEEFFNE